MESVVKHLSNFHTPKKEAQRVETMGNVDMIVHSSQGYNELLQMTPKEKIPERCAMDRLRDIFCFGKEMLNRR